jgi:hypothetical protein
VHTGAGGSHATHPAHPTHPTPHHPTAGVPQALQRQPVAAEEPLELVEEKSTSTEPPKSKIHGLNVGSSHPTAHNWQRNTHKNQTGAVRVRSFHCRLSEQGLEYMDHAINDWLDHHPDIEIKFTTSTVGPFDGKIKEPALILNVWY